MRVAEDDERRLLMTESVCFRFVVEEERLSTGEGNYAHRDRQGVELELQGFARDKLLLITLIKAGSSTF